MKKLFAMLALMGAMTFAPVSVMAQDAPAEAAVVEEGGIHKELKTKFIEGDAGFMSLPAIALVIGLAFCIERIVYLSLAEVNAKKLMGKIEEITSQMEDSSITLLDIVLKYNLKYKK